MKIRTYGDSAKKRAASLPFWAGASGVHSRFDHA
jgi:hypothetical protein